MSAPALSQDIGALLLVYRAGTGCRQYVFRDAAEFTGWAGRKPYRTESLRIYFVGNDRRTRDARLFVPDATGHAAAVVAVAEHFKREAGK